MLLARVLTHDRIPGISAERDVWGAVVTSLGSGVCIPTDALRSPASYSGMCRQLLFSGYKPPLGSDLSESGDEWGKRRLNPWYVLTQSCCHQKALPGPRKL